VAALKAGLPWTDGVSITPLPEPTRPGYLQSLVEDAVSKGANVINSHLGGGQLDGNLFYPAIVAPVTKLMKLWHEEQFGPVVPIAYYSDRREVEEYIQQMPFGQQAAVFSSDSVSIAHWVDLLSTAVGRININTQCGRSPDVFPFSGRRSSALGTLSVTEALSAFSVETVLACKATPQNVDLVLQAEESSCFLAPYF